MTREDNALDASTSCGHGTRVLTGLSAWDHIINKEPPILCADCEDKQESDP